MLVRGQPPGIENRDLPLSVVPERLALLGQLLPERIESGFGAGQSLAVLARRAQEVPQCDVLEVRYGHTNPAVLILDVEGKEHRNSDGNHNEAQDKQEAA